MAYMSPVIPFLYVLVPSFSCWNHSRLPTASPLRLMQIRVGTSCIQPSFRYMIILHDGRNGACIGIYRRVLRNNPRCILVFTTLISANSLNNGVRSCTSHDVSETLTELIGLWCISFRPLTVIFVLAMVAFHVTSSLYTSLEGGYD